MYEEGLIAIQLPLLGAAEHLKCWFSLISGTNFMNVTEKLLHTKAMKLRGRGNSCFKVI